MVNSLYDRDFYAWVQTTAKLLREKKFDSIDIDNLIEEIESMGRSEKRELASRLIVLLIHLLKWEYQPEKRSVSWLSTINEQRRQIELLLLDSPSLNSHLEEIYERCYQKAKSDAAKETRLEIAIFPEQNPFSSQETLKSEIDLPEEL